MTGGHGYTCFRLELFSGCKKSQSPNRSGIRQCAKAANTLTAQSRHEQLDYLLRVIKRVLKPCRGLRSARRSLVGRQAEVLINQGEERDSWEV